MHGININARSSNAIFFVVNWLEKKIVPAPFFLCKLGIFHT